MHESISFPLKKAGPVSALLSGLFVAGLALLILLQLPTAITYYGLARAASDDPAAIGPVVAPRG